MKKIKEAIIINEKDNVAVALIDLHKGDTVFDVELVDDVKTGHKIAMQDFEVDDNVIKYANAIGHAIQPIKKGEHIHTHNIKTNLKGILEYEYKPELVPNEEKIKSTFKGYQRENGRVGTRNEIWIVNTVGCVNKSSANIVKAVGNKYDGVVDGVFAYEHPFGCSQLSEDHKNTQKTLANMVNHPNAGGVLVLGLGCENNNIAEFKKVIGEYDERRVKFLNSQDFEDEVEEGVKLIDELVQYAKTFERTDCDMSKLVVGLKCGGSDGFSGITANPLVGMFSDKLIKNNGISVLTEVPEMFGAEVLLMNRCETVELFDKTVGLINNFKEYFIRYGQEIYENPSPGNKDGGITTLEDKSLGCTQKGGTSNVVDVLNYGETATKSGLNLLQGPGNDIVAITGLMSSGCNVILFTTGRGTPVGCPVPTVKIATNSNLFNKKNKWMDYNAGILLENKTPKEVSDDFYKFIIDIAEGKQTKNEMYDYREISIFKDGVTL